MAQILCFTVITLPNTIVRCTGILHYWCMVPLARLILHITRYIYIYIFHIYVLSIIVHRYFHKILRASLKHFPLLNSSHVSIFRCTFLYVLLLLFFRLFGFSFQMSHTRFRKIVIILLFSSSFRFLYCF